MCFCQFYFCGLFWQPEANVTKVAKNVLSFSLRMKLEYPILCNVLITLKMACKVLIKRFLKFSPFVTIRKWSNIDYVNSILSNEIGRRLRDCQQTNSDDIAPFRKIF